MKPLASSAPPRPCPDCKGAGGSTRDTSSDGIARQSWDRCTPCRGTGTV